MTEQSGQQTQLPPPVSQPIKMEAPMANPLMGEGPVLPDGITQNKAVELQAAADRIRAEHTGGVALMFLDDRNLPVESELKSSYMATLDAQGLAQWQTLDEPTKIQTLEDYRLTKARAEEEHNLAAYRQEQEAAASGFADLGRSETPGTTDESIVVEEKPPNPLLDAFLAELGKTEGAREAWENSGQSAQQAAFDAWDNQRHLAAEQEVRVDANSSTADTVEKIEPHALQDAYLKSLEGNETELAQWDAMTPQARASLVEAWDQRRQASAPAAY